MRAAVEVERSAKPLLRYRLGLALHHLSEPEAAIQLWLPLCWMDPATQVFHALLALVPMERHGLSGELIAQRRALQLAKAIYGPGGGLGRPWAKQRHDELDEGQQVAVLQAPPPERLMSGSHGGTIPP